MHFFIEFCHQSRWSILLQPGVAGVADNLQQPGPRVASVKTVEKSVGAQHGLLDYILRIGTVSQQPPSKIGGAVQMGQHKLLEPNSVLRL